MFANVVIIVSVLISLSLANNEIILENHILKSIIQTISDGKFQSNSNTTSEQQCLNDLNRFAKSLQNMEIWALDGII